ncbi:MAG: sulfur carrier protein ThiS [Actinomycetota bacterium]
MNVVINGDTAEVDARETLEKLVSGIAEDRRGVAAAVNGEVIPRSQWSGRKLSEGDRIEVLSAIGGG